MGSLSGDKADSSGQSSTQQTVYDVQSPFLQELYQAASSQYHQFQPNQELYDQSLQAQQGFLNPQGNPYLQQQTQQFRDQLGQLNQQTGGQAVGTGGFGGGRQGILESQNQQNVGDQIGSFLGNQYQSDQNRAFNALQFAPQLNQLSPQNQQATALNNFAGPLGRPTVLGSGQSNNESSSKGGGIGIG